jgi:hypothetical protein
MLFDLLKHRPPASVRQAEPLLGSISNRNLAMIFTNPAHHPAQRKAQATARKNAAQYWMLVRSQANAQQYCEAEYANTCEETF